MRRHVFLRIVEVLSDHEYFQMRIGVMRRNDPPLLQKCTVVLRILAYGSPVDNVDQYI